MNESSTQVPGSWFSEARESRTKLRDPIGGNTQTRIVSRTYDAASGNLLNETYWGADEQLGTTDDLQTAFNYSPNYSSWLVSYPYRIHENLGTEDGKTEFLYYDGSTSFSPPQQGLVTKRLTVRGDRNLIEKWAYDAFGNQTQYFDARAVDAGTVTPARETVYDTTFEVFPTLIRNALLHQTNFAFDTDFGEASKVRDPNGYLKCWAHDAFGRLTQISDRAGYTATIGSTCNKVLADFAFPSVGVVAQQHILETRHPGVVTFSDIRNRRFFDGLGRVYQEEKELNAGNFAITVRGWGTRGELACESLPFSGSGGTSNQCGAALTGARFETEYDALLRPKEKRRAVGSGTGTLEVSRTYAIADLDGKTGNEMIETRTTLANPSPDRVVQTGSDPQGRVVAVLEVGGGLTLLDRDPKGRIVTVDGPDVAHYPSGSDPNQLFIAYNHLGQRTSLSGLWRTGSWSYQYDANGNLSEQTSPAGKTIDFHWDELNRLVLKDYAPPSTPASPGTEDVVYTYDSASNNGIGRLAHVHDPPMEEADPDLPGVDTSFAYSIRGPVQSKVRDFGGSGAYPFAYAYDQLGRRTQWSLPNGRSVAHTYSGSVLTEIRLLASFVDPLSVVATNVQVHPSGALAQISYPLVSGGSSYTYEPDTYRLRTVLSTANGQTVQNLNLGYDLAGNLKTATDGLGELGQTFSYDWLHRLQTATSNGSRGYGAVTYGYDAAGNLRTKGPLTLLYEGGSGGPHGVTRVQSAGSPDAIYAYDDDGAVAQRTKDVTLDLTRDDDGRITSIPGVAYYAYDETGERSRKKVVGGPDILYVDPEYEVDLAGGTYKVHFFDGSRRIATENRLGLGLPADPGSHQSWQFTFPDFIGSNTVVVRDTGPVQKTFFQPFGEFTQLGGGLSPYLFTDQENDPESGFQYFGARYYDAWIGRFLEQDPELLGAAQGVTFTRVESDGQQFNSYSYATNRPTVLVDPTGRDTIGQLFNLSDVTTFLRTWSEEGFGAAVKEFKTNVSHRTLAVPDQQLGEGDKPTVDSAKAIDAAVEAAQAIDSGAAAPDNLGDNGGAAEQATGNSNAPKEGIYEFPDQKSPGQDYVGQSEDMDARLKTHEQSGRLDPGTEARTGVEGGKTAREVAEHKRIQEKTGGVPARESDAVSNKRDPIGERRRYLLDEGD